MVSVYDGASYLSHRFPDLPYIVSNGILPSGKKAVLFGPPKKGKSLVLNQLAVSVIHGRDWLGFKTHQKRVLYMNFEVSHKAWQIRLKKYCNGIGVGLTSGLMLVSELKGLKLDTALGQAEMEKQMAVHQPDLLILDPLSKILSSSVVNDEPVMVLMDFLDGIIDKYGSSVVICHHKRKTKTGQSGALDMGSEDMRGSYMIAGWVDTIIGLSVIGEDKIKLNFECRHAEQEIIPVNLELKRAKVEFEIIV